MLAAPAAGSAPAGGWEASAVTNAVDGVRQAAAAADPQQHVTDPVPLLELVSAGDRGRLYTLDVNEARAAVAQHGMKLQAGRVGYLRRQAFAGSTPLYRLEPKADPRPGCSLRPSASGTAWWGKAGFTRASRASWPKASGPGLVPLLRFGNSTSGDWWGGVRDFRDGTQWASDRFGQAVRNVRTDIAQSKRPPDVDNFVFAYAWNEWHEGGVLEPNARDGCAYLDVVRTELRLTNGSGCVANPSP